MTALVFSIENARQIQQDFIAGKKHENALNREQRRIIDEFRLSREQINAAYAKARKQVESRERL